MTVDPIQLVLLVVIVVLTLLLVILGVQVFLILREVRRTITKTNKVLDTADAITANIQRQLSTLSSLAFGMQTSSVISIAKMIGHLLKREKEPERKRE